MEEIAADTPPHLDLFRYLTADDRLDYVAIMTRFTSWLLADMSDPLRESTMTRTGLAVHEESLVERLIADLNGV